MIIEIDDSLTGEERRRELHRKILIYAIIKYQAHTIRVASFLGISRRSLHTYIKEDRQVQRIYRKERLKYRIKNIVQDSPYKTIYNTHHYRYSDKTDKILIKEIVEENS